MNVIWDVSLRMNPKNGVRYWVVDGEVGRCTYDGRFHECIARKAYELGIDPFKMIECNGCSGAKRCNR